MKNNRTYDLIGVGIGPFNLGLAALTQPLPCDALFFDKAPEFNWHPGLMLDDATLQVPFMADLVTMADPASPYSFLNYLKKTGRIYRFYIKESFFMLRKEYNAYCRWVLEQLNNCLFCHEVLEVKRINNVYHLLVQNAVGIKEYQTHNLVLGTGTQPYIPGIIAAKNLAGIIHTSDYLPQKTEILKQKSVTVVGSGQSAAEIVCDLLPHTRQGLHLNWITRSDRFFPLENHTRFTLEMTSPEYVDYFHALPPERRKVLIKRQNVLYKGVNHELLNTIFNTLYAYEVSDGKVNVSMIANSALTDIESSGEETYTLHFEQREQQEGFAIKSGSVIMATGYVYREPDFLSGISPFINRQHDGQFAVSRNYGIAHNGPGLYIQNGELHTHGLVSPDLGMGAYRNSRIINEVLGQQVYHVEEHIGFQTFDARQIPAVTEPALSV